MVSVDFWNTLVHADSNGEARHQARMNAVRELAGRYDRTLTDNAVKQARKRVEERFQHEWLNNQRTQTTDELVSGILQELNIPANNQEQKHITEAFRESLYDGPPLIAQGAREALAALGQYYRLSIISDTMFSPGEVIREYLRRENLLEHFDAFAFSDEIGVSKPHRLAYETVLSHTGASARHSWHVGDLQQTDIKGAQNMGMRAILYTGISATAQIDSTANYVCESWEAVADILVSEILV